MRETDAWQDIHPTYRDRLMVWEGKHKSQTIDGDLHTLHYRIDLFEDPKERAAFKAKYGRDLVVPRGMSTMKLLNSSIDQMMESTV